ncbi:MAG: hypothetical protein IPH31_18235 [Lewinellaceae bacterium]|nr:hypothetical protein [Lewinellaceae bacterium]
MKPLERTKLPLEVGNGIKTIYYSPSETPPSSQPGCYSHQSPFSAADPYPIGVELGSTQWSGAQPDKIGTKQRLLFGSIQYDSDSTAILKSIA